MTPGSYVQVDPRILKLEISTLCPSMASGATLCHAGYYPNILKNCGIKPRDSFSNVLIGTVTTQPNHGRYLFGVSYYDLKEGATNEDFFELHPTKNKVIPLYRGQLEKNDARYVGAHRGSKKYLLSPWKRWEIFVKKLRYELSK